MRADLAALLDDADRRLRGELLQPDRGRKARRAGADDHGVELHRFARLGCLAHIAPERLPGLG